MFKYIARNADLLDQVFEIIKKRTPNVLWMKDPKTGKKSVTLTVMMSGFVIASFKMLTSGIEIVDKVKMDTFTGVDYAATVVALGSLYIGRRATDKKGNESENSQNQDS